MPGPFDAVIGTIGLEVESESFRRTLITPRGWSQTHDASIETPVIALGNDKFIIRTVKNTPITMRIQGDRTHIGTEFISEVLMGVGDAENSLKNLMYTLKYSGEGQDSVRAGFHVHVGWAYDLNILKRAISISAWLESLLFHLGGMGREFRGVANSAAYCRPLTKFGPPVVTSNLGMCQMTHIDALMSANSIPSFWNRFGGINFYSPPKRYTPQRYMAVNLVSAFLHKTLEFRIFNTSTSLERLIAVVELCSEITRLTMSRQKIPDFVNSVYDDQGNSGSYNTLDSLLCLTDVSSKSRDVLFEILDTSPPTVLEPGYIRTHLKNTEIVFDTEDLESVKDLYPKIKKSTVPDYVDIHVIENELDVAEREELDRLRGLGLRAPEFGMIHDEDGPPDLFDEDDFDENEDEDDFDEDEDEPENPLDAFNQEINFAADAVRAFGEIQEELRQGPVIPRQRVGRTMEEIVEELRRRQQEHVRDGDQE